MSCRKVRRPDRSILFPLTPKRNSVSLSLCAPKSAEVILPTSYLSPSARIQLQSFMQGQTKESVQGIVALVIRMQEVIRFTGIYQEDRARCAVR